LPSFSSVLREIVLASQHKRKRVCDSAFDKPFRDRRVKDKQGFFYHLFGSQLMLIERSLPDTLANIQLGHDMLVAEPQKVNEVADQEIAGSAQYMNLAGEDAKREQAVTVERGRLEYQVGEVVAFPGNGEEIVVNRRENDVMGNGQRVYVV